MHDLSRRCALLALTLASVGRSDVRADPPACVPMRFEHVSTFPPFVCVRVEGTRGCRAASARGYVRSQQSGGMCGEREGALYTFALPNELESVGDVVYSRDLELLLLVAELPSRVRRDTVLGVALERGRVYRLVRGVDFGVSAAGVTGARLSAQVSASGAFTLTLSSTEGSAFDATLVVEPPLGPLHRVTGAVSRRARR